MNKITLGYFACFLILLGLTGCAKKEEEAHKVLVEPVSLSIDTVLVTKEDVVRQVIYRAQIVPETYDLSFERNGSFGQYFTQVGEKVRAGELLASLDTSALDQKLSRLQKERKEALLSYESKQEEYRNQMELLEITLAKAESEGDLNYQQELKKQGEIVREQLLLTNQFMEIERKERDEQIEAAKKESYQQYIVAPCDGVVVSVTDFSQEPSVGTDTIVITIARDSKLYLASEFISEYELKNAHSVYAMVGGKKVEVTYIPADPSVRANNKSKLQLSKFEITKQETPIEVGEDAILILVEEKREQVLTIPFDAVYEDTLGKYVYLVKEGSRVRQGIETGLSDGFGIEVTSGLHKGDEVYVKN